MGFNISESAGLKNGQFNRNRNIKKRILNVEDNELYLNFIDV